MKPSRARTAGLRLCAVMLLASGLCGAAAAQTGGKAAEPLGRLFFTPQQRQELDRRRRLNIREAVVIRENRFTVNGHVSRSSGKTTTWINGVPVNDSYHPGDPAAIAIQPEQGAAAVPLKIGQTLDNARGEITDGLAGGSVSADPRAAARR